MKKVTFKARWRSGKAFKESTIIEYVEATLDMIKLRACALNWTLMSVEEVQS